MCDPVAHRRVHVRVQEAAGLATRRASNRRQSSAPNRLVQVPRYWFYIRVMDYLHAAAATATENWTDYAWLPDLHFRSYVP